MMMAFGKKRTNNLLSSFMLCFSSLTSELLDILDEFNVPATFFLLGQSISGYPEVARRIAASHTIANHSWSHNNYTWMSIDDVRDDLRRTNDAIEEATGKRPKYFRAPYGYKHIVTIPTSIALDVVVGRAIMRLMQWLQNWE